MLLHEYVEAERCLQQALVYFRTANDRVGQGSALASLGHVRVWTCCYQEGIDLARRALDLLTPIDNWPGYYISLDTLAAAYLKTGRPGDAAELWQQAHEMSLTRRDRERVVRTIHNLGVAYQPSTASTMRCAAC
ncbi:tetratricopeptide repeat protein [Virgisporangium aurantiacum]|uniref:tetratricopeptide repeat protein n=1 Tax=Virgisporangium aurantiacum TaxID=175570 RepID=UPI00194DC324|nr:tetratricopeptide repeat protein [Virgisporangium aurantiacum]